MRTVVSAALGALLYTAAAVPVAIADTGEAVPHISILGTMTFGDADRKIDNNDRNLNNNGFQLGFGIPLNERLYIEGVYFDNVFETAAQSNTDFYQRGFGGDLVYGFGNREKFTPFVLVGAGFVENDVIPDNLDEDSTYWNVGVGFVGRIADYKWLRYRAEYRHVNDDYLEGMSDQRLSIGLEIALGKEQKTKEVVVEKVVYRDRPAPAPAPQPVDSDRDGVLNQYDRCPNTLAGAKVDNRGCVVKTQIINIENIQFQSNSATLTPGSAAVLSKAVAFLKEQKNLNAEVAGHTDSMGAEDYNLSLSRRRAATVKHYLVRNGVSTQRLVATGYGENRPVATNGTKEGRKANRRVELRLTTR
ncbi:MAG: OmpA family protein [Spongiibacteraceae bacterium]